MGVEAKIVEMEASLAAQSISIAELCRRAKIAATTWGRWKNGRFSPSWRTWENVEAAFASLIADPNHPATPAQQQPAKLSEPGAAPPQSTLPATTSEDCRAPDDAATARIIEEY